MSIEVQNITKTFGTFTVLRDVGFRVPTGNWSRCWDRPARDKRPSCVSLLG